MTDGNGSGGVVLRRLRRARAHFVVAYVCVMVGAAAQVALVLSQSDDGVSALMTLSSLVGMLCCGT